MEQSTTRSPTAARALRMPTPQDSEDDFDSIVDGIVLDDDD
jgi:hypothetical protein